MHRFPTFLRKKAKFPIDFESDSNSFTFQSEDFKMVENIIFNSDGFAIFIDELHHWSMQYRKINDLQAYCFTTISSFIFSSPIDHALHYRSLKFRILVANDIKNAYKSMIYNFGYIRRPKIAPNDSMFTLPLWKVSSFEKISEYEPNYLPDHVSASRDRTEYNILVFISLQEEKLLTKSNIWMDFAWQPGKLLFNLSIIEKSNSKPYSSIESAHKNGDLFGITLVPVVSLDSIPTSEIINCKNCFILNNNGKNPTKIKTMDITNPNTIEWFEMKFIDELQKWNKIDWCTIRNGSTATFLDEKHQYSIHNKIIAKYPNFITSTFANMGLNLFGTRFKPMTILETAYKNQIDGTMIKLVIDVDQFKSLNDIIPQMISEVLTLSLAGYQYIIPELINLNLKPVTTDAFRFYFRWIEAITFMSVFQHSYPVWSFARDEQRTILKITEICMNIREKHFIPRLPQLNTDWLENGKPIIQPIWLFDPKPETFNIIDQFMIGEDILVAPITSLESIKRKVYLPKGTWILQNTSNTKYESNSNVYEIICKTEQLLYFIRED